MAVAPPDELDWCNGYHRPLYRHSCICVIRRKFSAVKDLSPVDNWYCGVNFSYFCRDKKTIDDPIIKKFRVGDPERFSNPAINRKVTLVTAVFGSVLLGDALIHIMMALILSKGTYLLVSRIVTIILLVILFFASKWIMQRKLDKNLKRSQDDEYSIISFIRK